MATIVGFKTNGSSNDVSGSLMRVYKESLVAFDV